MTPAFWPNRPGRRTGTCQESRDTYDTYPCESWGSRGPRLTRMRPLETSSANFLKEFLFSVPLLIALSIICPSVVSTTLFGCDSRSLRHPFTMCDYTQVEYSCGHLRYTVKAWCIKYQQTQKRCLPNVIAM
jgi:hypothetical protein